MGNIGIWQLLIIAVIVVLLFGTKKLRNMGSDLGSAVKGFKKAVSDENQKDVSDKENQALKDDSSITEESNTATKKDKEST